MSSDRRASSLTIHQSFSDSRSSSLRTGSLYLRHFTAIFPSPHLPLHLLILLFILTALFFVLVSNPPFLFPCLAPNDIKMIASLVINSIRSVVNALERSEYIRYGEEVITMKNQLKNLEFFVLCVRKLGDDAQLRFDDGKVSTLASLLQRIHHALPAHPYNWSWVTFLRDMDILKKEIGVLYTILLVSLPQPTFDEVTDIVDSILENLYGLLHYPRRTWGATRLLSPIEALIEKMTFLRNFIRFVTLRSVEPQQLLDNLLVHVRAVAVDAAHTCYIVISESMMGLDLDVEPNVPALLQMIKMIDPQVDETYRQALTSSKLSTQLYPIPDKDYSVIMKDFIDFLLWNLWERLHTDTRIVNSTYHELQLVYEGLRLLRNMLKEQPNKFDNKIGELTRVVICDAGIIIFSLYQKDIEVVVSISGLLQRINRFTQIVKGKDFSIPDLLQRISRISQRAEGKDLLIPDLLQRIHHPREQVRGNDLPRTNELGFIDFVLENLLGMTSSKECHGFQSQFQMIHDELSSLRYSLGKMEGVRNEQKELEALRNDGVKVAYGVEFLIDQLVFRDFQGSSSASFDYTVEDILKEVKSVNSKILNALNLKVKKVCMTPNPVPSQNRAPIADEIVGFEDDITSIIDGLTRGSKQLKMVAIVGMPGIGKTTLATKVFNHPSVTFHFHVRLQCCVSQLFHKKNVLLELLNLVDPNTNINKPEEDLTEELWRHLKGKRYLIFLDDVWDIEAWDSLKTSFPNDSNESRILMTSRHLDAVPQEMCGGESHFLRLLTDEQSWELLRKKLPPRNDWSVALDELGKQIAANCKGLPLTVVVIAGLLANMEPQGWNIFLDDISSVSVTDQCTKILDLSYKHLPGHLKECFLYFGLFPADQEVSIKRLIRLWIAEGFVRRTESKNLEDVARDYIMDLVGRSLVIVSKKRSRGGVKSCKIHDLLHDFCRIKAKEEKFFQLLNGGYDESLSLKEPCYVWRLCVHSVRKHFKNLRLLCPLLRSLLFFPHREELWLELDISFVIPRYSRLRVLDTGRSSLSSRIGIPSEIELVLQLKYLSVCGSISEIPSSIGSLANLETFILHTDCGVSLPDTFWNLKKLRHLDVGNLKTLRHLDVGNLKKLRHLDVGGGFCFLSENLEKFSDLCELQSCSCAIIDFGESIKRLARKFPNIRKLRCQLSRNLSNEIEILIPPHSLSQLESLHLRMPRASSKLRDFYHLEVDFCFPGNLRKLSLDNIWLHQSGVSKIGKLPNLEVLKFEGVNFRKKTWDMVEGEFSRLRFLKLSFSGIVRWRASDDQFPCLRKLVLANCYRLKDIPSCFENIGTLEMVEVSYCRDSVNSFFKRIQDEQMEMGNSFLNIQISKRQDDSSEEDW